jgi:hypothetical protein
MPKQVSFYSLPLGCLRRSYSSEREAFTTMATRRLQPLHIVEATSLESIGTELTLKLRGVEYLLIDHVGHAQVPFLSWPQTYKSFARRGTPSSDWTRLTMTQQHLSSSLWAIVTRSAILASKTFVPVI